MRSFAVFLLMAASLSAQGLQRAEYTATWDTAIAFDRFLQSVGDCETEWRSRFANAAIDADTLTRTRALRERRRLLISMNSGCTDSRFTVPYIAKLAAAVPERLELRVKDDTSLATPRILILTESNQRLESADVNVRGKGALNEVVAALEKSDRRRK